MLLVNKQFPDASEFSRYQTTLCMCFPEMPQHLLKGKDVAVVFDEEYTPFLLEIDFGENEMYLSQREMPMSDYLEQECK